ncbi:MAG: LrgB family protein [Zoogloeaceae bacterium]|jgi:predicted murein hydrolase (TIGR00659 family)|nr:LrgB family protein [Zoogloeaceae bacterium]
MIERLTGLWDAITALPLFGLTLTLLAYWLCDRLYRRAHYLPLLNPVLLSIIVIIVFLQLSGVSYPVYFNGAQFIHFLLGPATVALAIPLYSQFRKVRALFLPLMLSLCIGSTLGIVSAVLLARLMGASLPTLLSISTKSATTPIAMGIAEHLGGIPSLAVGMVMIAGIGGAMGYRFLCRLIRVRDPVAQGFAVGLAAHGVGTARALQLDPQSGAFAALAMSLNGLLTALLAPLLIPWLL